MVNVISEANLLEINTKHSWVSSIGRSLESLGVTFLAMKLIEIQNKKIKKVKQQYFDINLCKKGCRPFSRNFPTQGQNSPLQISIH